MLFDTDAAGHTGTANSQRKPACSRTAVRPVRFARLRLGPRVDVQEDVGHANEQRTAVAIPISCGMPGHTSMARCSGAASGRWFVFEEMDEANCMSDASCIEFGRLPSSQESTADSDSDRNSDSGSSVDSSEASAPLGDASGCPGSPAALRRSPCARPWPTWGRGGPSQEAIGFAELTLQASIGAELGPRHRRTASLPGSGLTYDDSTDAMSDNDGSGDAYGSSDASPDLIERVKRCRLH